MAEEKVLEKQDGQAQQQSSDYSMDRLAEAFETSAKRWELIVYPSLFAFILLAGYGFYLIYSLARDVHYLAISVDTNMTVMASNFQSVSDNMNSLTRNIHSMSGNMEQIHLQLEALDPMMSSIDSMDRSMGSLDQTVKSMTVTTQYMRNDMAVLNRNISRPISFMNNFMPW